MKLVYISNNRMPIELAHGLQVMQMCSAFVENNCTVELVVPRRVNPIKDDPFTYYGIKKTFSYARLPTLDLIFLNSRNVFFWIQTVTFLISVKFYLFFKKYDILYTREQMTGLFFSNVVLEIHSLPKHIKPFHLYVWKRARRLVVLTSFIQKRLIELGISAEKIIVAADGVNLTLFDISLSQEEARKELHLPKDKKLVGYVGMLRTLGMEKGIDIALRAMSEIKDPEVSLLLVGGHPDDIEYYKKIAQDLGVQDKTIFVGRVFHSLVPLYLKACDVLIAPFPKNEHYSYYMSPMKVFEYMASKRPLVSTNLPSLQEILEDSAFLVEPGNADQLREGIEEVLNNKEMAENLAQKAYTRVREYTWQKRAEQILKYEKIN